MDEIDLRDLDKKVELKDIKQRNIIDENRRYQVAKVQDSNEIRNKKDQ